jgi:hypothetical protein
MSSEKDNFVMLPQSPHSHSLITNFLWSLLEITFVPVVFYTNPFLLDVSLNFYCLSLYNPSSLDRNHSLYEAPPRSPYYVCRTIWNCEHYLICLWLIVGSVSVTLPSTSRCSVSAWIYSGSDLEFIKSSVKVFDWI